MQKINYKNVFFNIDKNLNCKDISFKNIICIQKISFSDKLLEGIKKMLLYKKIYQYRNYFKRPTFYINAKEKRNYLDIICSAKTSISSILLNIKVYKNPIFFIFKVISNKNLLYGIRTQIHCLKTTKVVKSKLNSNWKIKIKTSFDSIDNNIIVLSPKGNSWFIKSNGLDQNYNTTNPLY